MNKTIECMVSEPIAGKFSISLTDNIKKYQILNKLIKILRL